MMMVSKETQVPSELPMCEAPILPSPLIHRSAWNINSANFAFREFSEVDIPALCVAPSLCGRNSYVEIKGSWPCLHKTLSGAMEQSELRRDGVLRSSHIPGLTPLGTLG
jgi:hypothetical protein